MLRPSRSALLTAQMIGSDSSPSRALSRMLAMKRSPGPTPSSALMTSRATSAPASSASTFFCMRLVSSSRGRWTPGRSIRTSWVPASRSVATPRIARRVVCGPDRGDRHLCADDSVDQGRLADVGPAGQTDETGTGSGTGCRFGGLGKSGGVTHWLSLPRSSSVRFPAPTRSGPGGRASRPCRFRGRNRRGEALRGPRLRPRSHSNRGKAPRRRVRPGRAPAVFVDRKGEHVGRLVLAAMFEVQFPDAILTDDLDREVTIARLRPNRGSRSRPAGSGPARLRDRGSTVLASAGARRRALGPLSRSAYSP